MTQLGTRSPEISRILVIENFAQLAVRPPGTHIGVVVRKNSVRTLLMLPIPLI
jgi:hypothetical protein